MSRVTFLLIAAAAMIFAAGGTANAQCCSSGYGYGFSAGYAGGGCCNSGFAYSGGGCCNSGFAFAGTGCGGGCGYAVQAAPVVVQAAPVVVQQPVVVRQPVIVQQQAVVQQYVVKQGPVYAGPALSDYRYGTYYGPRAVGAYPYVGRRYGYGYRRAHWAPRPYYHRHHYHRHHGPVSVYN